MIKYSCHALETKVSRSEKGSLPSRTWQVCLDWILVFLCRSRVVQCFCHMSHSGWSNNAPAICARPSHLLHQIPHYRTIAWKYRDNTAFVRLPSRLFPSHSGQLLQSDVQCYHFSRFAPMKSFSLRGCTLSHVQSYLPCSILPDMSRWIWKSRSWQTSSRTPTAPMRALHDRIVEQNTHCISIVYLLGRSGHCSGSCLVRPPDILTSPARPDSKDSVSSIRSTSRRSAFVLCSSWKDTPCPCGLEIDLGNNAPYDRDTFADESSPQEPWPCPDSNLE